ncbi:Pectinesterase [Rhynchospora pubera]|uniref:Pectinesterase n=1 Tax=Rhynchospora pubera TaxID=906938 RepID=A0AAV8G888_9POAL|nr:Pectinesterase [Rhynchospora pubera]
MYSHATSILLLAFFFLPIFSSLAAPNNDTSTGSDVDHEINQWCAETPHPHACINYFSNKTLPYIPKEKSDFFRLSFQFTLHAADRAQSHLRRLGPYCNSTSELTALLDCWKLYANAVLQLNRTLNGSCTHIDSQTWLSAALTSVVTCRKGFADLDASDSVINPIMSYNVSDLISNLLALNKAYNLTNNSTSGARGKKKLNWMKAGHRKLLQLSALQSNLVVAQDGSGNYGTILDAINVAAAKISGMSGNGQFVIHIKAGVYSENLQIVNSLTNLVLVGDGIGKTIITGSQSVSSGFTTFSSATFSVLGNGFMATGITFRNTFGPTSQAVAMLSGSDRSIFYKCSFEGYQDTLCTFSQRQFYRECNIYGTVDFIFGNAAAVFQKCNIYTRVPVPGQANVITAQGRSDPNQNTGIVIQSSNIKAAPEFWPIHRTVKSFLGRPWQQYSRTIFVRNYIDSIIDPAGWTPTVQSFLNTLYFAEYGNSGPGSRLSLRVKWPGYHIVARPSIIQQFTASRFIAGRVWIPATGVPFDPVFNNN